MSADAHGMWIFREEIFPASRFNVSWKTGTFTVQDAMLASIRQATVDNSAGKPEPFPIRIVFRPSRNLHYRSRFRVQVKHGNAVDLVLCGSGTFEEHLHNPTKQTLG
jgi:hypothetical protein